MIYKKIEKEYRKMKNGYLFSNGIGLNELAFQIWSMCENVSEEQLIKKVFDMYNPQSEEDKNLIQSDVVTCLNDLFESDLVERE